METRRKPIQTLRDVRKPARKHASSARPMHEKKSDSDISFQLIFHPKFRRYFRKTAIAVAGVFSLYVIFIGFFAHAALDALQLVKTEFPGLKASAQNLNTGDAVARLDKIHNAISGVTDGAQRSGLAMLSAVIGTVVPGFSGISGAIADTATLNEKTLQIAKDADFLKTNGIELFTAQHGSQLIAALQRLAQNITAVSDASGRLTAESDRLGSLTSLAQNFSDKITPIESRLSKAGHFLDSLVTLLQQPGDEHILLLFQNPTEIRPAGGFIGSFGDLVISQGNMKELKIDDIYNADRQLGLKLAPPHELSGITPTWGARDANWFFDFPTSAMKVSSLLESSDLFKSQGTVFQGVIAINTNILQSLLEVTGPITLDKYNLTITADNFLPELQREVEAGQDKKPGQNPKRILSALAPLLMEKLHSLSADQKSQLISKFKYHLEKKDIMIYFRDPQMQNFVTTLGIAGDVLQLPDGFSGDYLAVIDTNIASGKTDAVISQDVTLNSSISSDGKVIDALAVTRSYHSTDAQDWWYHVANKNYLKVLAPENSALLSMTGNDTPPILGPSDNAGLQTDPELASIEAATHPVPALNAFAGAEFGKTSFGAWMTTRPGTSKTVTLQYQSGAYLDIHDGMRYQFVFEKQSGVESSLEYSVAAPPGYIWKESGKNSYASADAKLNARETVYLTLIKE